MAEWTLTVVESAVAVAQWRRLRTVLAMSGPNARNSRPATANNARNRVAPPAPAEPLLRTREVAAWLNVPMSTFQKWCAAGAESGRVPPFLRVNGQLRWYPSDVRAWLEQRREQ